MARLSSTIRDDGRISATVDRDLIPVIERLHHAGEPITRTINRVLRAGVNVIRQQEGVE